MTEPLSPTSRGEQAKTQLIASAITLFGEKGIHGATTREIAQQAGQNIAAITYYFASKEGLYLAVAQWIADFINRAFQPVIDDIDRLLAQTVIDREHCRHYLRQSLFTLIDVMTRPETLHLSQIMFREQLAPTGAYDIIHRNALSAMHRRLTRLAAGYAGADPDDTRITLHAHALLGEVLSFRFGRATLMMQAGWQTLGPPQARLITEVIGQHIDWLLAGLRTNWAR
ncbi:transcriptional regulator CecR [Martelella alba]|uniref:Transcriptional regulator n=1 Tax=Martelella alba TaxID=2590451 RepID=A0ABY2SJC6_9HYPH|nr:transcriptional regulator CecR [Martelella alba]TKI05383.1 transcriptional regulator [Martelella alba]